jgi:hypothetical protein
MTSIKKKKLLGDCKNMVPVFSTRACMGVANQYSADVQVFLTAMEG